MNIQTTLRLFVSIWYKVVKKQTIDPDIAILPHGGTYKKQGRFPGVIHNAHHL